MPALCVPSWNSIITISSVSNNKKLNTFSGLACWFANYKCWCKSSGIKSRFQYLVESSSSSTFRESEHNSTHGYNFFWKNHSITLEHDSVRHALYKISRMRRLSNDWFYRSLPNGESCSLLDGVFSFKSFIVLLLLSSIWTPQIIKCIQILLFRRI